MAFRLNIFLLLLSALLLVFLSSKATAQLSPAPSPFQEPDDADVIKNVEKNEEVQALGRFAVDEVNKNVSNSESFTFNGVVTARRWQGAYDWNYFFVIKSEKTVTKQEGRLFVYVYTYSYGKGVKTWIFEPTTHAWTEGFL